MIKFGVCREEDIPGKRRSLIERSRKVSIPLVLSIWKKQKYRWDERLHSALEIKRVFRTTSTKRFCSLDAEIAHAIHNHADCSKRISIHDMACSSGFTTCDLYDSLACMGVDFEIVGSDYHSHVFLVRREGSKWISVLDADFDPIQYVGSRFVLSTPESRHNPGNRILLWWISRRLGERTRELARKAIEDRMDFRPLTLTMEGWRIEREPLFAPESIRKAEACANLSFMRHDIFSMTEKKYHFIRAMNILNLSYFKSVDIHRAIKAIHGRIFEGGLLLVGRSDEMKEECIRATLFVRRGDRFELLKEYSGGSEIKDHVLGII